MSHIHSLSNKFQIILSNKITKQASEEEFSTILHNYEKLSDALKDTSKAWKRLAHNFAKESDMEDPVQKRIFELLLKQAESLEASLSDIESMEEEIDELNSSHEE